MATDPEQFGIMGSVYSEVRKVLGTESVVMVLAQDGTTCLVWDLGQHGKWRITVTREDA